MNKRTEVVQELRKMESLTEPIVKIMETKEVVSHIQQSKDGRQLFDTLSKEYDVRSFWSFSRPTFVIRAVK